MNKEEFIVETNKINLDLDEKTLSLLEKYYNILIEENKKYNLTRIIEKEDVYLKHFYDSLTITKIIDLTNVQKDLTFDFRYFLEGLRAFFEEDYKKAITVCAPALEAAILNGIKNFAANKNIYFLDKLLKKYILLLQNFIKIILININKIMIYIIKA